MVFPASGDEINEDLFVEGLIDDSFRMPLDREEVVHLWIAAGFDCTVGGVD